MSQNAEAIKYSSICEIRNGWLLRTDSFLIQINAREGDSFTKVEIPYSKGSKLNEIDAWIEDLEGNVIRHIKKSEIKNRSAISDISLYEDNFEKYFELKENIYPFRIGYTYQYQFTQFLWITNWTPVVHYSIPTRKAQLKVILPSNYLTKVFSDKTDTTSITTENGTIIYTWKASYKSILKPEVFAPDFESMVPNVIVAPVNFFYGISGSNDTWQSYGNWYYRLGLGLNDLPQTEKNEIDNLLLNISSDREKVKIIYHYMQDHTRYINVSIGIGGMKPYPASYVSQNKYGDCKALTNYMMALLEFAGIKSYPLLINTDKMSTSIIKEIPGPQFNHIMLCVPIEKDTIWLENTDNTNPFGYVGTSIQNKEALFIDEANSRILKTPCLGVKELENSRFIDADLGNTMDANLNIRYVFKGFNFESFKNLNSEYSNNQQDEIIKNLFAFKNYELLAWRIDNSARDSSSIRLNLRLKLFKFQNQIGNETYFSIFPTWNFTFETPKERKLPLHIPYSIVKTDSLIYKIPEGFEVKSMPEDMHLTTTYGKYNCSFIKKGEKLIVIKFLNIFKGNYTLEEYSDFYSFQNRILTFEKIKIVLLSNSLN